MTARTESPACSCGQRSSFSIQIRTGTRCTTFVNSPDTTLRGIRANWAPVDLLVNDRMTFCYVMSCCFVQLHVVVWINKSTGAQFALMPRNVVSGEFTKVVQRVPVRIWIEKDDRWPQLQAGLSVRAVIDHGPGDPEWAKKAAQEFADLEGRYSGPQEQRVGSHDTDTFQTFGGTGHACCTRPSI